MNDIAMSTSQSTKMTSSESNQPQHPRPVCRDFIRGVCARGSSCKFSHDESNLQARRPRTSKTPCKFFQSGTCVKGNACRFAHSIVAENDSSGMGRAYTCERAGAVVTFGDGATVTKLSLPSDLSAVRVTGLADTVTKREVALLLSRIGGRPVHESNVSRLWNAPGGTGQTAEVQVEDPMFAGLLRCQGVASGVKVIPIAPILQVPGSSNTRRVDCRKVVCSWERPTRGIRLEYDSEVIARQVYEKFHSGDFTIFGDHVKAYAPIERREVSAEYPFNWRVQLENVAGTDQALPDEIFRQIPKHHWPRQTLLGPYTYNVTDNFASDTIQFLLQPFGLVDRWEISQSCKGRIMMGTARFRHEAEARDAVRALHDTGLPFNNELRLSVQLMTEANFKVPARVYDTVREQIGRHKRDWEKARVTLVAHPETPGNSTFRDLSLEGEDSGAFAKAQEQLRQILAGRVVCDQDGKTHQIPIALYRRSRLTPICKLVERRYSVHVQIDAQKRQFRIIGPDQLYGPAVRMLLSFLKSYYEEKPPAKPAPSTAPDPEPTNCAVDCAVCWTQPEAWETIRTSCGHTYCLGCFAHLAHSTGTSTTRDFEIRCAAENCDTVFPLAEIQRYVPSETFEQILDASLASYIARGATHGKILKYCPTPDCGNIFQSTATLTTEPGSDMQTCHKCLKPVCTNCHVDHIGMSCAKYQETKAGGLAAFEAAKRELGVKDCPKCGISIERAGGCNHVVCEQGCGTHICWVCLRYLTRVKSVIPTCWTFIVVFGNLRTFPWSEGSSLFRRNTPIRYSGFRRGQSKSLLYRYLFVFSCYRYRLDHTCFERTK